MLRLFVIILHSSDLITFISSAVLCALFLYIYKRGLLKSSPLTHPKIWLTGVGFLAFSALSRLGSFLDIWLDGSLWFLLVEGLLDFGRAIYGVILAHQLWNAREEIVTVGRGLSKLGKIDS